jgi:hypothetical protein
MSYTVHTVDFKQNIAAFIDWRKLSFCISPVTGTGIADQTGEFGTD